MHWILWMPDEKKAPKIKEILSIKMKCIAGIGEKRSAAKERKRTKKKRRGQQNASALAHVCAFLLIQPQCITSWKKRKMANWVLAVFKTRHLWRCKSFMHHTSKNFFYFICLHEFFALLSECAYIVFAAACTCSRTLHHRYVILHLDGTE